MKRKFIIQDWAGNIMDNAAMVKHYKCKSIKRVPTYFKSFDDAEYFLSIVLDEQYEEDRQEYYVEEV